MRKYLESKIDNLQIKLRRINSAIKFDIRTEYNKGRKHEIETYISLLQIELKNL